MWCLQVSVQYWKVYVKYCHQGKNMIKITYTITLWYLFCPGLLRAVSEISYVIRWWFITSDEVLNIYVFILLVYLLFIYIIYLFIIYLLFITFISLLFISLCFYLFIYLFIYFYLLIIYFICLFIFIYLFICI